MELRRNLCVLPSNAPVQERSDCSKRVFQDTSGNLQSSPVDNVDALTKESYDSQVTSRSPPASTQQVRTAERPDHKGRRHVRKLPILTKSELNSEKYLAYRARQRANIGKDGEPVWPDDLEEAFQRGLSKCFKFYSLPTLIINSSPSDPSYGTHAENARRQSMWEKRTYCSLHQAVDGQSAETEASIKSHPSS